MSQVQAKEVGATEYREAIPGAVSPPPQTSLGTRIRGAAANFWLRVLFFVAQHAPWFGVVTRGWFLWWTMNTSRFIRNGTAANCRRILGENVDDKTAYRFGRAVLSNFIDFICDIGRAVKMSREQIFERVESIDGHDKYLAARALKTGAIVVTAHMGSFEAGIAALRKYEERIHVVFKRDTGRFEQIRQALRQRLGVVEQPVDDGWGVWMNLRDALRKDEVVAIQGDRVMPGQKGMKMPILGGHLLLPTGPVKLAMASGAPIVPVFSVRTPEGRIKLFIEEPIIVAGNDIDAAMQKLAATLQTYIARFPEQWLVVHPAFCEDVAAATATATAQGEESN
jgi:KDO2-lipid IV(A) lauroyltransferase